MALLPPNQLLHLGADPAGAGWNHFNLGLGLSTHINYGQSSLGNSPPVGSPWFYSKTNADGIPVVQFSAPLGGATTSTNTHYARSELRELERNGTTNMSFDPKSGDHWIEGIYRVTGLATIKPEVCVQQMHDPSDDVIMCMIVLSGGVTKLVCRYNGSQVAVLDANYTVGEEFYLKSRVLNGTPMIYYSSNPNTPSTTPITTSPASSGFFSGASSGWYQKTGCYNQSNEETDPNLDPDASIIKVEVRELKHWHSATAAGGAWPTPAVYTAASGTATVSAGADASVASTGTFSRTGTVTLNGSTLTSQEWRILSGPSGAGTILSTTASVSWSPSAYPVGRYTLQFKAVTSSGDALDTVDVVVSASGGGTADTYPTFVGFGAPSVSDGSTSVPVAAPAGVTSGMFQICVIMDPTEESITGVPANWFLMDDQAATDPGDANLPQGGPSHAFVYYNTTGDTATRTWTKDGARGYHAVRMAWKDWSTLGEHFPRVSALTTTPYSSTVDPATNAALAVSIMCSDRRDTTAGPVTVPTGWTSRYNDDATVNTNEIEWIAVADIQATNGVSVGANAPTASGVGTSNFTLTNADQCALFSFVLEGVSGSGVSQSGAVSLTVNKTLKAGLGAFAGTLALTALPALSVRPLVRAAVALSQTTNLLLNSSLFPRGAFIILPTLTFQTRQTQTSGLLLEALGVLRAGALPYRKPVLRTDYKYPPLNHPFRLIAQRILDGEIVEWELPVDTDFEYQIQLSGPVIMSGKFAPEIISVQELNLDGYAYWLHVEINQQIAASAIMLPAQYEESAMSFSAEGISAAPHYHIYDNVFSQIQVDPLSIVRTIWNYVQSQPQSDLGVVVSTNSSPVRLGEAAFVADVDLKDKVEAAKWILDQVKLGVDWTGGTPDGWPAETFPTTPDTVRKWSNTLLAQAVHEITGVRGQATYTAWLTKYIDDNKLLTTDKEAAPYELAWYNATNCGEEIDKLAGQTPFDYIERHAWNSDKTDVLHYFDMGYPRIGKAQPDLLFNEENILEVVPIQEGEDTYASAVLVIGAGEGEDTIRGYAAQSFGDRVRKEVVVTDKTITTTDRANAQALTELAIRRGRAFEVAEIVISAYHPYAPIGSYGVGDDIKIELDIPWLMETHIAWYRITSILNKPSSDKIRLGVSHAGAFDYTEELRVISPDAYIPFEPPVPGVTNFPSNVVLTISAAISMNGTVKAALIGATALTAIPTLVSGGVVFRTGTVSMVVGKTLTAAGIVTSATGSTATMIVNKTLSVNAVTAQQGTVNLTAPTALTAGVTAGRSGATALTQATTLTAASGTPNGAVSLVATPVLAPRASALPGAVTMTVAPVLVANGIRSTSGAVSLSVGKTLTAGATVTTPFTAASVASRSTGANNTGTTTHTITKPAGLTASQGILVCFTSDTATATATTTSTGWVALDTQVQGTTTNHRGTLFWAQNAATAANLVVNMSAAEEATWAILVVNNPGVPEEVSANGSGLTGTMPSLTLSHTGDWLSILYVGTDASTTTTQTCSIPTGYGNQQVQNPTVTSSAATFTMDDQQTGVSVIAPGVITLGSTEQYVFFNVAFPGA